jgi:hypothetical protein
VQRFNYGDRVSFVDGMRTIEGRVVAFGMNPQTGERTVGIVASWDDGEWEHDVPESEVFRPLS